jgi:hypothetical protein
MFKVTGKVLKETDDEVIAEIQIGGLSKIVRKKKKADLSERQIGLVENDPKPDSDPKA